MRLSILICTIVGREEKLIRLLGRLEKQTNEQIEILIEKDNKEIKIGTKRNLLLERAKGDYICFIDDDDMVTKDYIPKILQALTTNPDCCGIEGIVIARNGIGVRRGTDQERFRPRELIQKKFIHSIKYEAWFERGGIYYRCPNHLNPIKRELALQVGFPDISRGEDKEYSLKLRFLLKKEVYINNTIYFYLAKGQ